MSDRGGCRDSKTTWSSIAPWPTESRRSVSSTGLEMLSTFFRVVSDLIPRDPHTAAIDRECEKRAGEFCRNMRHRPRPTVPSADWREALQVVRIRAVRDLAESDQGCTPRRLNNV